MVKMDMLYDHLKINYLHMNKVIIVLVTVLLIGMVIQVKAADKVITFAELPQKAQAFVKKHFSQKDVILVKMDTKFLVSKEYEVKFNNGTEVEFDSDGEWKKIDMKNNRVPAEAIPMKITEYVQRSFPNTFIKEIKKNRNKIEVEISNGLELEFTKEGDFKRIDD